MLSLRLSSRAISESARNLKLDDDTSTHFANSTNIVTETVLAIRTVSSLALEREIIAKYEGCLKSIAKRSVRTLGWMMFLVLAEPVGFVSLHAGGVLVSPLLEYPVVTKVS